MICEKCGKDHDGTYTSGRFCSPRCARGFSTKDTKGKTKEVFCKECGKTFAVNIRARVADSICKDCIESKKCVNDVVGQSLNVVSTDPIFAEKTCPY